MIVVKRLLASKSDRSISENTLIDNNLIGAIAAILNQCLPRISNMREKDTPEKWLLQNLCGLEHRVPVRRRNRHIRDLDVRESRGNHRRTRSANLIDTTIRYDQVTAAHLGMESIKTLAEI
jgi:hypothetical protein